MASPVASAPDNYLVQAFATVARAPSEFGTITVDVAANDGSGTLKLNADSPNMAMTLQFCAPPNNGCYDVTSFTSDAQSQANAAFVFPKKGANAGMFQILGGGSVLYVSGIGNPNTQLRYQSALLPASSINGGLGVASGNAVGGGRVTLNQGVLHIVLSGPQRIIRTPLRGAIAACIASRPAA